MRWWNLVVLGIIVVLLKLTNEEEVCSHPTEQLYEINRPLRKYLKALLRTYYFCYIKLNLQRPCLYFKADPVCTSESECRASASASSFGNFPFSWNAKESSTLDDTPNDNNVNFALFDNDSQDSQQLVYYNLLENPERFTGYSGKDAQRIWHAIYLENCHYVSSPHNKETSNPRIAVENVFAPPSDDLCLERTLFYRLISGMHTSVSTHLSFKYFNVATGLFEPNVTTYQQRVGLFPERKNNFLFTFVVLFRAIQKISAHIQADASILFLKEAPEDDKQKTRDVLDRISKLSLRCPNFFNEQLVFNIDINPDAMMLKKSFREHFQNVSRILDCVACQRCRLWGKIQIIGLGTALKILFSYPETEPSQIPLSRVELVALYNTIGKYSETLNFIQRFEEMVKAKDDGEISSMSTDIGNHLLFSGIFVLLLVIVVFPLLFAIYIRRYRRKEVLESACGEHAETPCFHSPNPSLQRRLGRSQESLVED